MTTHKFLSGSIVKDGAALGPREIRAVISTSTPDRIGDVVEPLGGDFRNYKTNNIVLASHDRDKVVGTGFPTIVNGRVEALIRFAPAGISQHADTWCGLVKSGTVNAVSIGFNPIEYELTRSTGGTRFKKWELLEISLVAVPANAEAVVVERAFTGRTKDAATDDIAGPLAALDALITKMAETGARARAAHPSTEAELYAAKGAMGVCQDHLEAMLAANGHGGLSEPAPVVDRATAAARRRAALDGLNRANIGSAARPSAPRELGGAWLSQQVREDEARRLRAYWAM